MAPTPISTRPDYSFMKSPQTVMGAAAPLASPAASPSPAPNPAIPTRTPIRYGAVDAKGAYNPYTKGYESVNSKVGVNYGQYSPDAKQQLWGNSGNTGDFNMDAFYRGTDGSLQIKPEFVRNVDATKMSTPDDANAFLRAYETDRRSGVDYGKIAEDLRGTPPPTFNRAEEYARMRQEQGVDSLTQQINDLNKEYADLEAVGRARKASELGKPVAMGVIAGRINEEERQQAERLDTINRQRQYLTDQLKVKNDAIGTLMTYKGQDYDTATKEYDSQFNKNSKIIELVRGMQNDEITRADKIQDNARATLTTVYNSVTSGGLNPNSLTPQQKLDIRKLEVQAGMPPGIIQNLYDKNPKSDIVFTTKSVEADGNEYVQMVVKDRETGAVKTEKFLLGKSADYAIKKQNADNASIKAAKYKSGGSGGSGTSASKSAQSLKKSFDADSATWSTKINSGTVTQPEAHNYLYKKYGDQIKAQGYTDDQVKNIIYNKLK